jgi:hypothetical protein
MMSLGDGQPSKALIGDIDGFGPYSGSQLSQGPVQRIHRPVVVIPAEEPAHEGRRLKALPNDCDGGPPVPICWICLDVPLSCRHTRGRRRRDSQSDLLRKRIALLTTTTEHRQRPHMNSPQHRKNRNFYLNSCFAKSSALPCVYHFPSGD